MSSLRGEGLRDYSNHAIAGERGEDDEERTESMRRKTLPVRAKTARREPEKPALWPPRTLRKTPDE